MTSDLEELFETCFEKPQKNETFLGCNHQNTVTENGGIWCITCGTCVNNCPTYVRSYNHPYSYKRIPVYSRQKRFMQYILNLNSSVVRDNYENILLLFGRVEFFWNIFGTEERTYFFNRAVTLFFIAAMLDLDIEVRTLKDKTRVDTQLRNLSKILELGKIYTS